MVGKMKNYRNVRVQQTSVWVVHLNSSNRKRKIVIQRRPPKASSIRRRLIMLLVFTAHLWGDEVMASQEKANQSFSAID